jgi:hypothetical protein
MVLAKTPRNAKIAKVLDDNHGFTLVDCKPGPGEPGNVK